MLKNNKKSLSAQTHPCKDILQRAGEGGAGFILENIKFEATAGGCTVCCCWAGGCILSDHDNKHTNDDKSQNHRNNK